MHNRLVAIFFLIIGWTTLVHGQTYTTTILLSFTGPNGADPQGGLVRDGSGNLYGTTFGGGDMSCLPNGCGIVFKLDPSGNETILHQFTGPDGANPTAGVVRDAAGNLYGTTLFGGTFGQGAVFKIDTTGTESVLFSFSGAEGANPVFVSGLVQDAAGNLYGTLSSTGLTSSNGGSNSCGDVGCGLIFKLDHTGQETILYSFTGAADGENPQGGLILDSADNLYGTTYQGGAYGCGTVFKLNAAGSKTILYSFTGGADGGLPTAGVILDPAGNVYGTTSRGGIGSTNAASVLSGNGTVFEIGTNGKEMVLYSFTGGMDGGLPIAGVIRDAAGNLYGTTELGGVTCAVYVVSGCGTVFKLDATGKETTLYVFALPNEGFPVAGLILDAEGNLYGTAQGGSNGSGGPVLVGAVYEASPTIAAQTGMIQVSTNLSAASFTITGPATYTGTGTSFAQLAAPIGTYTITFTSVAGYITPGVQTQTLIAGTTLRFSGTYTNCTPPHSIFSNTTGTDGLLQTSVSTPDLIGDALTANVTVANSLRLWLGLTSISPYSSTPGTLPTFSADLGSGIAGTTAKDSILPPCQSNTNPFAACSNPGVSTWTASFCSEGNIALTFAFTPYAALLSVVDAVIPGSPPATLIALTTALQNVPDLNEAGTCLASGERQCALQAFSNLFRDPQQLAQTVQILRSFDIQFGIGELEDLLLVGELQLAGNLLILDLQTHFNPFLNIDIIGQ